MDSVSSLTNPDSWEMVRLGSLVEKEKGKKPKNQASERSSSYFLPYINIQAFEEGVIDSWTDGDGCRICDESDFLMVWDGSRSGLVGKGMKGALGSTLVRISFPLMENQYAYYFLQSKYEQINSRTKGSGTPHVDPDLLWNFEFPVPPLNEQRRILAKIEELFSRLDKSVESLRSAKSTLDLYRKSLLKTALEGRLTADWRAKNLDKLEKPDVLLARIQEERETGYEAALHKWERAVAAWKKGGQKGRKPVKPKKLERFDLLCTSDRIPWPCARVQSLLDAPLINGRSVKDKVGGFPVLRLTALKNGRIDFRESKEGDWSQDDAEPFFVERDDIFIARGNGSKKLVGIASLVLHDPPLVAFPDTMIRARLDTSAVRPEYFLLAWNSSTVRQQIEKAARTTAGIYKINQGHVRGFVLPLPSLAEQAEIVRFLNARLEVSEALAIEVDASIARAEALRQSILKKAFAGQLVAQDPNDEPASVLLERIKAQNITQSPSAKIRRQRRRARATA